MQLSGSSAEASDNQIDQFSPHARHTVFVQVCVPLNLLDQGGYSASTLMQLQPGGVVGCATCPDRHVLLAASGDGTISAIDYR